MTRRRWRRESNASTRYWEGKSRDAMLNYVTELISVYAPRDRALTSVQLAELSVDSVIRRSRTTMRPAGMRSRSALLGRSQAHWASADRLRATARIGLRPAIQRTAARGRCLSLLAHVLACSDAAQADALIGAEALPPSVPKRPPRRGEIATNVQRPPEPGGDDQ